MVSCTLMCSAEPPVACVTAHDGLPKSVFVPPHGAAFCGSPRSFSISQDAGASSLKCACVATGASTRATTRANRIGVFIGDSSGECRLVQGQQLSPRAFRIGLAVDRRGAPGEVAHAPA